MLIEEELPDAVGKMKQFASWFTHGVPGGAALRKAIYESKSTPEILARVKTLRSQAMWRGRAHPRDSRHDFRTKRLSSRKKAAFSGGLKYPSAIYW